MAEIEIVYRKGYCEFRDPGINAYYCEQCHSEYARDTDCLLYDNAEGCSNWAINGKYAIRSFDECVHAKHKYIRRGMSVKNYELEEDLEENCMILKTKNDVYKCEKVVLNGKVVFNKYDEEIEKKYKGDETDAGCN